jgi:hypothetical protein
MVLSDIERTHSQTRANIDTHTHTHTGSEHMEKNIEADRNTNTPT